MFVIASSLGSLRLLDVHDVANVCMCTCIVCEGGPGMQGFVTTQNIGLPFFSTLVL